MMQMLRRAVVVAGAALLLVPAGGGAAELSTGNKDTVYIGEVSVPPSVSDRAASRGQEAELRRVVESLEAQLVSAVNGTRLFQLVERKSLKDLKLEQDFTSSGNVDPDDGKGAQAGRMAGAAFAFLPVVDGFEDMTETVKHRAIGRTEQRRRLFISATVRVVDTTSGKLLPESPGVQLTKEEVVERKKGEGARSDEALLLLARETAEKLSRELAAALRPAKILSVTGKQIMINRGSDAGFNEGDELEIYATQSVKDDDTGENYRNEVPVGRATVVRLDGKQSFATIRGEDLGVAKGCIVRVVKGKARGAATGDASVSPGSSEKPVKW
jgi:hypothetical protein